MRVSLTGRKGGMMMKRVMAIVLFMLVSGIVFASQEHHTFYTRYALSNAYNKGYIYGQYPNSTDATGDQIAVNTYTLKSFQVSPLTVGGPIAIRVEGRSKDALNLPNWAILTQFEMGAASSPVDLNKVIAIDDYVDFIRVGLRAYNSATSDITIYGIFDNLFH